MKKTELEVVIEGDFQSDGAGNDYSANWIKENPLLARIEKGIPLTQFEDESRKRKLDMEFKLVKRLTETVRHSGKMVEYQIAHGQLNRYKQILPCTLTLAVDL